ncbi:MAG: flagellar hook capping FlgD N-terminal domain-containing protein [Planctomycetota bacterium]
MNSPAASNTVVGTGQAEFGENQFLDLLVAELRTQTPLDPVDNDAFTQQLATFSNLREQQQINENLLQLLDFQGALARIQGLGEGSALLGKEIEFAETDGSIGRGIVDSVSVGEDGTVRLRVGEGSVDLTRVVGISQPEDVSDTDASDGADDASDNSDSSDDDQSNAN